MDRYRRRVDKTGSYRGRSSAGDLESGTVIEAIRDELPNIGISIDTRRPSVAMEALESGADMVNDVSSIGDPEMVEVVTEYDCPICIMP